MAKQQNLKKRHLLNSGLFALVIVLIDQAVKLWVLANFTVGEVRPFIPNILQFHYYQNTGMAFGLLAGHPWFFIASRPLLLTVFAVFLVKVNIFPHRLQQFALIAVMAGGFSNWIDNIAHGFVIDMFEPTFMSFAIFNVADSFITVGVAIILTTFIFSEVRKNRVKTNISPGIEGTESHTE